MLDNDPHVTITFEGLMLFCHNKAGHLEAAVLECPEHKLTVKIQQTTIDPTTKEIIGSETIWNKSFSDPTSSLSEIGVEVKSAGKRALSLYTNSQVNFDRAEDSGDPKDFRWLLNLEGEEFGNQKLKNVKGGPLAPIITVTDGKVYSDCLSDVKFKLYSPNNSGFQDQLVGRIAFKVGVDINLEELEGESVSLSFKGAENEKVPPLKRDQSTRYLIAFNNRCSDTEKPEVGTDFRLVFDRVSNASGDKFDLQRVVENGGRSAAEDTFPGNPDFSLDLQDLPCMGGFLGDTEGFSSL
jgi:hypothetical protein